MVEARRALAWAAGQAGREGIERGALDEREDVFRLKRVKARAAT
jgi:hypothetical protein